MDSADLQLEPKFNIQSLRSERPKDLDRARNYLKDTLREEYFAKVEIICERNQNLAKYKGIIMHDINRQLSSVVSKITMDSMQNVDNFEAFISPELSALESVLEIIDVCEENPQAMFDIGDLNNSISINNFEIINDIPELNFDLAVLFSIRTLLLNAKTEARDVAEVKLMIKDNGLETHFIILDNSSREWPARYLTIWSEKYDQGFSEPENVTEIKTGGAGLVAYTSGQREAKFSAAKRLVNYNDAVNTEFKNIEVIFPHTKDQLVILS